MKKTQKQNIPKTFDDALPEQLLSIPAKTEGTSVRLRVDEPLPPSPFVVRLSRPETALTHDPIAELKKSLIFDTEEADGEAPLVEAEDDNAMIRIALRDQLLERDTDFSPIAIPRKMKREVEKLLPSPALKLQAQDLFADFDLSDLEETVEVTSVEVRSDALPLTKGEPEGVESEPVIVRIGWSRSLAAFVAIAMLLVLPLQALQAFAGARGKEGEVKGESKVALDAFLRGATSLSEKRFTSAGEDFSKAAEEFQNVEDSLNDMHAAVVAIVNVIPSTERTVSSVHGLVTAGQELSETAELLSLAGEDIAPQKALDLVTKIELLSTYIEKAKPHVLKAEEALSHVDPAVIPPEYQDKVAELQGKVPSIARAFEEYVVFTNAFSVILGGEEKVRYLAAFQNNTEIRPTGGFVGSFAEVDMKDGAIEKMNIPGGGSYASQGQLNEYVAAPGPLQLLKARWEFQDANWFPDFPSSAEKMLWFREHSGGSTMDGVIAVNATFVQKLLGVLGPVEMPEYGRTINAENFLLETQKIVELEYDKEENAPKAFIGDLAPILLERITNSDLPTLLSVLDLLGQGLREKDIMVYFADNELQSVMENLSWTGSMKDTSGDYLMVVNTNLGGGKTDTVIDQEVSLDVNVATDGIIENTVTIKKTHRGMKNALFTGANNVDYLRIYVPEGARLISASGFEIPGDELFEVSDISLEADEDLALRMKNIEKDTASGTDIWDEDGKTVFGNWMQTAPGETETVSFTYRLPERFDMKKQESFFGGQPSESYSLFLQKQPGVISRQTKVKINMPAATKVLWTSPSASDNLTAASDNKEDAFFAWLLEP